MSLGIYRLSFVFHIRLLYSLESLEDKNVTLEDKNETLEEKNESLEEKNESLEEKNESLEDKNTNSCPAVFKEINILMWKTQERRSILRDVQRVKPEGHLSELIVSPLFST